MTKVNNVSGNIEKSKELVLDSSELLAVASRQVETKISLIEAGRILVACGLSDSQEYNTQQCDRFTLACTLIKKQGKTLAEVAAHFEIALEDKVLIEQVHGLLGQVSSVQAEHIRAALPKMAAEQLQEVKALFWRMTARKLRQYVDSKQLDEEIRQLSKSILATAGKHLGLLRSNSSPKNLKTSPG